MDNVERKVVDISLPISFNICFAAQRHLIMTVLL